MQFPHLETTADGQHYFLAGEFVEPNWVFAALLDLNGRALWSLYVEVPGFDLEANISSWFELDADNRPILYRFFLDSNQRVIVKLDPDRDFSPVYAFEMEAGGWGEQRFFRTANGLFYITQSPAGTQIARWDLDGQYGGGLEIGGSTVLWSSLDDRLLSRCGWTLPEVEGVDYTVQPLNTDGWTVTELAVTVPAEPPTVSVTQTNLSDRLRPYAGFTHAWGRLYWQTLATCGQDLPDIIPPRLMLTADTEELRLSWLAYGEFVYELQSTGSLAPPVTWTPVGTLQDADGLQSQAVARPDPGPLYYRLKVRAKN